MDQIDFILNRLEKTAPGATTAANACCMRSPRSIRIWRRLWDIISFDPALTAKVLQICNSAVYRGSHKVNDVSEAVNRLGLRTVYGIVAAVVGKDSVRPGAHCPAIRTGVRYGGIV